ncbi:MAG TPA: nicotinate-nucleotide adenylyltransferase [Verrucomicrobiae bacterium]|nr:nicotinate-nucleotide adenylyltransferase [Verrucomicrobiae bacterium]
MKIGLFGGTFDPIHWGHLRSAEEVREAFRLERIVFIPTSIQPLKNSAATRAADRLAMARLATADNRAFMVSDAEVKRPGKSFTIDTLRAFSRRRPKDSIFFIIGMDAFRDIGRWKDFKELFRLAHFIVTSRPGCRERFGAALLPVAARKSFCYDRARRLFRHESGTRLYFLKLTDIAISASEIRARVRTGRSVRYLVPAQVERYIKRRGLYRASRRSRAL